MEKINAILVTVIGALLALSLIGIEALQNFPEWIIAIIVLVIGIMGIVKNVKSTTGDELTDDTEPTKDAETEEKSI